MKRLALAFVMMLAAGMAWASGWVACTDCNCPIGQLVGPPEAISGNWSMKLTTSEICDDHLPLGCDSGFPCGGFSQEVTGLVPGRVYELNFDYRPDAFLNINSQIEVIGDPYFDPCLPAMGAPDQVVHATCARTFTSTTQTLIVRIRTAGLNWGSVVFDNFSLK